MLREIRISPVVRSASVLISTARGMRPRKGEKEVARDTHERLDWVISGAQCNFFRHTPPRRCGYADCQSSYHGQLEICPRPTAIPTGFELGSGLCVSTISPETPRRGYVRWNWTDSIPGNNEILWIEVPVLRFT